MKNLIVYAAVILFICTAKASPESLPELFKLKNIPVVDALIQRLESEEWADDEEACFRTTLQILHGVRNDTLWATWIWDSMQPPLGVFYGSGLHAGNFDQCLKTPWSPQQELSTQYCQVEVKVQEAKETRQFGAYDSADEYLNTVSIPGRTFNHHAFGVCMPAVCSPSSIAKYLRHAVKLSHVPDPKSILVDPGNCQTAEQKPYPEKFYLYLYVFQVLLVVAIFSTIYSNYNENGNNRIDGIAKSFSMTHNWKELFKVNSNEIRVLNGMKVISAYFVIICHQVLLLLPLPSIILNSVEADVFFKDEIGQKICHLDLVVDTFLAISGLLLIRGLMSARKRNLPIVLLKRYFRLIGPYAAMTFYTICMARHTGSGPIWLRANANEEGICEKHWWQNLLMSGNDSKTICYGVAWYVTCDYHLAILTVILFWIYRRSKKAGVVTFLAVSFALIAQLAVNAYSKRLPMVPFANTIDLSNVRDFKVINDLYIRWHDRGGSYLVGVAMGWLMSVYKPADYRNVFSKTTSFIMVVVSLYIMMKVATVGYWLEDASRVQVAVVVATNRVVWAMAICAITAICEYGSIAAISNFLGSEVFVPISRLTYGIYMTHFFIIQRSLHSTRSPLMFDPFNVVFGAAGTFVLACAASLVLYVLVEAPCVNISNLFFSERKEKELNGIKPTNALAHRNGMNGTTKLKES